MRKMNEFKKGAASFYIVAIATLLLVIIATSFIAVIISEITRTSNNDLAQSAYDSALAGIEDAKLAYYNYQECLKGGSGVDSNCSEIRELVEAEGELDCNMTANILGRTIDEGKGVLVKEGKGADGSNNMQQAYTCVVFKTELSDYVVTLDSANPTRVVRPGDAIDAKVVKSIKVSWRGVGGSEDETTESYKYAELDKSGIFGSADLLPPVLSVGLIQTSASFGMDSFDMTKGDKTNRGTLYLVPASPDSDIPDSVNNNYKKAGGTTGNFIDKNGFLKSNDKTARNLPYVVRCNGEDAEYFCSAIIDLPSAVDSEGDMARINDTFSIVLNLPYSNVKTDVKVEYFKENGETVIGGVDGAGNEIIPMTQDGAQIEVDSTGRANDLYRRVVTRLNVANDGGQYPIYAIQLLGTDASDDESLIDKNFWTTCEYNFSPTC